MSNIINKGGDFKMALKKCKECGAEISSDAKTCPKCGKNLTPSAGSIILGIMLCIFGLYILFSGLKDISYPSNNSVAETTSSLIEDFTLLSDTLTSDEFGLNYIEGSIQNNTSNDYSYVQVNFILYDEAGNQVGTALDNINNLKANGTWKFKAAFLTDKKVFKYELAEITGW